MLSGAEQAKEGGVEVSQAEPPLRIPVELPATENVEGEDRAAEATATHGAALWGRVTAEKFESVTSGIQSLIVSCVVIAGVLVAAPTVKARLEQEKLAAEVNSTRAEAALKQMSLNKQLQRSQVLQVTATPTQYKTADDARYVSAVVSVKNDGENTVKLELSKNVSFYVARVEGVGSDGMVKFGARHSMLPDYADKTITWVRAHPGGDDIAFVGVQRVPEPGLYLLRFAVEVPDDQVGANREYSSETYFEVK